MASNLKASQHTAAQRMAAVHLCAGGLDPEAVSKAVGAAARTIRYWGDRAKEGTLTANPVEISLAVKEYAARMGVENFRPLPKVDFDDKTDVRPSRAVLPEAPKGWRSFDPKDPKALDAIKEGFGVGPSEAREPSEDASMVAALLGAEPRVPAVQMEAPPPDLNADVQQLAASYGPQAIFYLAALARAMSENRRLPGWQLDQFKTAANIWGKLAALAAPRPKVAEYVPPKPVQAVPKKLGEALHLLGDLVGQVNDPRELEALEGLIRKLGSGEVQPESPSAPVQ